MAQTGAVRPPTNYSDRDTRALPRPIAGAIPAFAMLLAPAALASAQPYLADITRWTTQDALNPPPAGAVLFTGSSSIRRWEQLTLDFADYEIIQRGFGGSQFENLNFYVNDIVLPYAPRAIVVWEGTNDLSSGETAGEVFADYQSFVALVHASLPACDIFYLGVTPTPANDSTTPQRTAANALIAAEAATDARLHYIDLPAFFDALDPPDASAFKAYYVDAVHLNRRGYDAWTSIIRPAVSAVVAPNKTHSPNADTLAVGERMLFDFGPSNPDDGNPTPGIDAFGNRWNNWHPAEGNVAINAGEHIANLITTAGRNTRIELVITGGFLSNGRVNGGLLAPQSALLGDLAVPTATEDYFFCGADDLVGRGNDDVPGGFMLTGLDPDRVYELRFFATRNTAAEIRITDYVVTGANTGTASLQTSGPNIGADGAYDGNDDTIALVSGIRPDAFGQVFVDVVLRFGTFAYLGALDLRAVPISFADDPEPAIVDPGGTLVFSATPESSTPGMTLRWEKDGVALADTARISGATTTTLRIDHAGAPDEGAYRLVATAGDDTRASRAAIGAVRGSSIDGDVNGDGDANAIDVLDLLDALPGG